MKIDTTAPVVALRTGAAPPALRALRIALVVSHELVRAGLAAMLTHHPEVELVSFSARELGRAEVVLVDLGSLESVLSSVEAHRGTRVVTYADGNDVDQVRDALRRGAHGVISMELDVAETIQSLRAVVDGQMVAPGFTGTATFGPTSWPGRSDGLTEREARIMALITQGLTNQEILVQQCLSINTVKSYIRSAYRKLDVTTRVEAVLWGIDRGLRSVKVPAPDDAA